MARTSTGTFARFRVWRRARPFWAGVCTLAAGLAVLFPPFASLRLGDAVITLNTLGGISATVIGAVLLICGTCFWTRPQFRTAAGIVTLLLALAAIPAANLGSLLIATVLGLFGSALGIAWSPSPKKGKHTGGHDDGPDDQQHSDQQRTGEDQRAAAGSREVGEPA